MARSGLVAVQRSDGTIYVGWRMLGTEPTPSRSTSNRDGVCVNETADRGFDELRGRPRRRRCDVRGLRRHRWFAGGALEAGATVWKQDCVTVPLRTPEGYRPNDASVGDLDGDGAYEVVLAPGGTQSGQCLTRMTDPPILEAYRLDGNVSLAINLGRNIREGAPLHSVHGLTISTATAEPKSRARPPTARPMEPVKSSATRTQLGQPRREDIGRPEFFHGLRRATGAALATADYIPPRGDIGGWGGIGATAATTTTAIASIACSPASPISMGPGRAW